MTFTVPKMLRPYFLHHRELLGRLSRAAWETVSELMAEVVGEEGFRPGMVVAVHTAGDFLKWHPHAHAVVSRGGWLACGEWVPVPYLDALAAERLFRHKVLSLCRPQRLLEDRSYRSDPTREAFQDRGEPLPERQSVSWRRMRSSVEKEYPIPPLARGVSRSLLKLD